MIEVLFYIAGAVTIVVLFTLWCIVSIERVRNICIRCSLWENTRTDQRN